MRVELKYSDTRPFEYAQDLLSLLEPYCPGISIPQKKTVADIIEEKRDELMAKWEKAWNEAAGTNVVELSIIRFNDDRRESGFYTQNQVEEMRSMSDDALRAKFGYDVTISFPKKDGGYDSRCTFKEKPLTQEDIDSLRATQTEFSLSTARLDEVDAEYEHNEPTDNYGYLELIDCPLRPYPHSYERLSEEEIEDSRQFIRECMKELNLELDEPES